MHIYFPQWQGAGPNGVPMKTGAEAILQYIGTRADKFVKVGISQIEDNPDSHPTPHIHCCAAILEQLSQFRDLIEKQQPTSINTLGGDCGIEIIPVSYLNHRLQLSNAGKLGVLWFDAHTDLNLPQESPSKNFHGMPVRTLLGEGAAEMIGLMFSTLEPEQVVYVGARDLDPPEKEYIAAKEIKLLQKLNVGELKSILQDKAITHVYVHLDLDCLDPEEYPHTFYQVARGLGITNVHSALKMLNKSFEIVGCSLLESIASEPQELKVIDPLIDFFSK